MFGFEIMKTKSLNFHSLASISTAYTMVFRGTMNKIGLEKIFLLMKLRLSDLSPRSENIRFGRYPAWFKEEQENQNIW